MVSSCGHMALAMHIPEATYFNSKEVLRKPIINHCFNIDYLSIVFQLVCADCDCKGPNLWICLYRDCLHIGCAEKTNDHSTNHNRVRLNSILPYHSHIFEYSN